jgi:von Willebrand factor type D domain
MNILGASGSRTTSCTWTPFIAVFMMAIGTSLAAAADPPAASSTQPDAKTLRAWAQEMSKVPTSKKGCFGATYPERTWREEACVPAPNYPMPPRQGPRPLTAGDGNDIVGVAPAGLFIRNVTGSFDSVSNVTSEKGKIGNSGPEVANAYTLQVNANTFSGTSACSGAADTSVCKAWEQFVFENNGSIGRIYIQYWLLNFNKNCPSGQGWNQFSFTGSTNISCWKNNSAGAASVAKQPITNLANLVLVGAAGTTKNGIVIETGHSLKHIDAENAVGLNEGWTQAEFNVLGDGGNSDGGGQANFNDGAILNPRIEIDYGSGTAPGCRVTGFTGETNNLGFGGAAPPATQPGPAILFSESIANTGVANCLFATTIGDTHLQTFHGLFYDFQAAGDFVLAQSDPGFVVQTRQVSGAPTWPNATVNKAVATQMGDSKIAICLSPARILLNGEGKDIADGKVLSTADGVDIWHNGNVYTIIGAGGDSVRATVNGSHIDVTVGLGHWPANVSGLLANPKNDVNHLAARDGAVFANPLAFTDLYAKVGASWRVPAKDSLLNACNEPSFEKRDPSRPFFAKDLDRATFERTRAVCVAAGVKAPTLLDACTLDVAVIGDDAAAKVYVDKPEPVAVGTVTFTEPPPSSWRWLKWLLVLLVVAILWVLFGRKKTP